MDSSNPQSPIASPQSPIGNGKTVIAPCMGVGKIVASVTRRASYLVKGQCPEDVELLSLPALLAGDAHERELLQTNPSIVIDGCALRCAAHIYRLFGVEPAAKVEVAQIMKERKAGPGKTRKELEETGKKLSGFTAERVIQALEDEGLMASYVAPDDLTQLPPDAGASCPHRGLAELKTKEEAVRAAGGDACPTDVAAGGTPAVQDAAVAEAAATTGVCASGLGGQALPGGKHKVESVTILPCQGIKRTGGRVTQRAAYHVVEDRYLGRTNLLCISALAAGVQEDVDMLEKYPTVAINGCGLRCATVAAQHHGIPAVASVDLQDVDPGFKGDEFCYEPDLTETEATEALKLADAVSAQLDRLLDHEIEWRQAPIDLHGLVHEPGKINAQTGYADDGRGLLVKLAQQQAVGKVGPASLSVTPAGRDAGPTIPSASRDGPAETDGDFPGLKRVVSSLFKPKAKPELARQGDAP